jgi:glycerate kinase
MRVLVAPDKFKGTLTAAQAAEAIATGWARAVPETALETVPMADGGEGTLDALMAALGGERFSARVRGPLGDAVDAEYGLAERGPGLRSLSDARGGGLLGVVEMARASGLGLVAARRRDPARATTYGTGELIAAACRRGASTVLVCIGGSATNDGGAGMAQAVGIRLLDRRRRDIPPGGTGVLELASIDMSGLDPAVAAARFVVATDVDSPLTGPLGASAIYGPQKGASPEQVALLDRALGHLAAVIHRDLGVDVRDVPGAGAAGGLGAGLMAFLGAKLRAGVDVVMDAVGLPARMERADLVVTGEGGFDRQSMHGKVVSGVLRAAAEHRVPAVVLAGRRSADPPPGVAIRSLAERFGARASMARPRVLLADLAAETAEEMAAAWAAGG